MLFQQAFFCLSLKGTELPRNYCLINRAIDRPHFVHSKSCQSNVIHSQCHLSSSIRKTNLTSCPEQEDFRNQQTQKSSSVGLTSGKFNISQIIFKCCRIQRTRWRYRRKKLNSKRESEMFQDLPHKMCKNLCDHTVINCMLLFFMLSSFISKA